MGEPIGLPKQPGAEATSRSYWEPKLLRRRRTQKPAPSRLGGLGHGLDPAVRTGLGAHRAPLLLVLFAGLIGLLVLLLV